MSQGKKNNSKCRNAHLFVCIICWRVWTRHNRTIVMTNQSSLWSDSMYWSYDLGTYGFMYIGRSEDRGRSRFKLGGDDEPHNLLAVYFRIKTSTVLFTTCVTIESARIKQVSKSASLVHCFLRLFKETIMFYRVLRLTLSRSDKWTDHS